MSSSAITTQVAQLKISSIQNQADSSGVYSAGVWSFKNSTAVASVTISDAGSVGIGTASPSSKLHVIDGNNTFITNDANTYPRFTTSNADAQLGLFRSGANAGGGYIGGNGTAAFLVLSSSFQERMRIDASGNVLVGTSTQPSSSVPGVQIGRPGGTYWISANAGTAGYAHFAFLNANGVVGSISTNGLSTAYSTNSDYRLKEDVQPMVAALSKVAALKPCTYKWKADGSEGEGFIAHELAEVCPAAVTGEKDAVNEDGSIKTQGIDPSKLVGLLVAAIQELEARLAALESK